MDPNQQDVYEMQWGAQLKEVIINRDMMGSEGLRTATQRPALPAVVAHLNEETKEFYLALVALRDPFKNPHER
jgi:Ni,Fe-hydrogenase III component G